MSGRLFGQATSGWTVHFKDITEMLDGFEAADKTLASRAMNSALKRLLKPARSKARATSPRRTGGLRKSIIIATLPERTKRKYGITKTQAAVRVGAFKKVEVGKYDYGNNRGKRKMRMSHFHISIWFHVGTKKVPLYPFIADAVESELPSIHQRFPDEVFGQWIAVFERRQKKLGIENPYASF